MKKVVFGSVIAVIILNICFIVFVLPALIPCQHTSMSQEVIAATCSSGGKTINRCDRCDYEIITDTTSPSDHVFSEITVEPTCARQGYTMKYCSCGYSFTFDYLSPSEHSLIETTVSPTCDEQGYSFYECELCGYDFKSDFVQPIGHSFTATVCRPTSTRAGYTHYECHCSYEYKGDYVYYSDILESAYVENTTILAKGLDVSRWNHQIDTLSGEYLPLDWSAIKIAGFDFVIIKAGSTKSGIEPTFEMDYAGARAAGLEIGAYFYTYSTTVDGILNDARSLVECLKGKQFEYPIYLDLEDPSLEALGKNHLGDMCVAFLEHLQENGYYAGLYTNHKWLTTILDSAKMVSLFDIWYARYPGTSAPAWNEEKYGKQLGMWQYTQSGSIDGIDGSFDFNYSYKDYTEIMKKWHLNGF